MGTEALNCKCCGGVLKAGTSICECEYCGAVNIVTGDSGKYIYQLNRANKLRQDKDFDRAIKIYDDILAENQPTADVLWSRVLCEYGIEYVADPASNKYLPTLHRIKEESILNNASYLEALEIADANQKSTIENEARDIAKIQNEYLDIVSKEKPYDVFICYKETDDATGQQTEDSGLGLDLYERLVNYGFKVFFSRVTLQDKLGVNYEPYIFGALKSSKVMAVIGTKPEYFSSVWVKNEWSRFLRLMDTDKNKQIFFACDDVEDLPKAFSGRQAQLLNQPNAIQNLAFSIKRCLEQMGGTGSDNSSTSDLSIELLIIKAKQLENESDYIQALELYEKVLKNDPNNTDANEGKNRIKRKVEFASLFEKAEDYKRQGDFESAKKICEQILQIDPNNERAKTLLNSVTKISIGGYDFDYAVGYEINNLILKGDSKMAAIKLFKDASGADLKIAKEAVEAHKPIPNLAPPPKGSSVPTTNSSGGCYVATCVYGSYDCPEVWTLRRYRDYNLDKTWYGRAFIKTYYAISPTAVKLFGDYDWFKKIFRRPLDNMVAKLSTKGYENTPYEDKY